MNAKQVRFDDSHYKRSHGKQPRGRGHWAFGFGGENDLFWCMGKIADAKRCAVAEAARRGFSGIVYVMP